MFYENTHFLDPFKEKREKENIHIKCAERFGMQLAQNMDFIRMMEEKEYLKNRLNPRLVNVWFNEKKGVTVVKWSDGTITKVTLQNDDVWDEEKAIALCYMKKFCGNNSSFNEVFRKHIRCYDYFNPRIDEKETLKAHEHFKEWSEKYKDIDFLNK